MSKSNSNSKSNSSKTMKAVKNITVAQRIFVSLITALFIAIIAGVGYLVYLLTKFLLYKKREEFSSSVLPNRENEDLMRRFVDENVHRNIRGVMEHFIRLLC